MKFTTTILGLLLLFTGQLSAQKFKLTDTIAKEAAGREGILPNGLHYYIRANQVPEGRAELRLIVNAGSMQETNDQKGLAHFMEHMNFNGSKHFPKNQLVDFLQKTGINFGADLNAQTSFDETIYILPIPTESNELLDSALMVLEDWAFNNAFDSTEIDKERGVVLEESRLNKGAQQRMANQFIPRLFNGSQYAQRLPIGDERIIQTFTPATLKKYYRTWYRPNLMAVIVVGDVDEKLTEAIIKKRFGGYRNPNPITKRPTIFPVKTWTKPEAMVVTDAEASSTALQIFHQIKPSNALKTWNDYRKSIINNLVTVLLNDRLSEITDQENPPYLFAQISNSGFIRGYDVFTSTIAIGKAPVEEALSKVIAETNRARRFGFLENELERAKINLINSANQTYQERDKIPGSAYVSQYISRFLKKTPMMGIEQQNQFLNQMVPGITLSEINLAAAALPPTTNAFTLLQGPSSQQSSLPSQSQLLAALTAANNQPVQTFTEKKIDGQLLASEPIPGKIVRETLHERLGMTELSLSNNITVWLKPTTLKNDDISMDAWRWGGFHNFDLADKINSQLAAVLVNNMGVANLSPSDLDKFLTGRFITITPYINPDENGIEGSTVKKDLETFFQLIHAYYTNPRSDVSLLNSFINKQKASVAFAANDPDLAFEDTLQQILYNNHPWIDRVPKPADYDAITLSKIMAIYRQVFSNADGLHFTFVGNIDVSEMKRLLEKYIASLPAKPTSHTYSDLGIRLRSGPEEITLKKGVDDKAVYQMFFEGPTDPSPQNKLRLQVLTDVLNIHVIEKLREEMSGIYGGSVSGRIFNRPYAYFSVNAAIPCGPKNLDTLGQALTRLIQQMQNAPISEVDLQKAKSSLRKHRAAALQTNDFWLSGLTNAYINRENPETILDLATMLDKIDLADVQKASQEFLNLNKVIIVKKYPQTYPVEEGIKKLGAAKP